MEEKDALLVLSGGMDSTTMLYDYQDMIGLALFFDYGQNHLGRERECARYHASRVGVELVEVNMDFIGRLFESTLLKGGEEIPSGEYGPENLKSTVVPFRNGIMLSVAAGLAESRGLKAVMIANHSGDHAIYPDCRQEFVDAMGSAIAAGTFGPIELRAPYTGLSKTDIARRGLELGVEYDKTYSCYRGGEEPCGECSTCREREQALREARS